MKQDTPSNSAERVKAFRDRLDSQFKRVEAYVTEEEKVDIQAVRAQEGVTMDVAVAGLVRLGLERYEELRAQEHAPAQPKSLLNLSGAIGDVAPSVALNTAGACGAQESVAFSTVGAAGALSGFGGLRMQGAMLRASTVATPEPADNPVARFFKTRKEILNG